MHIYQSRCLTSISGYKEIMMEVSKREKEAGIVPDPDIDTYMKVSTIQSLISSPYKEKLFSLLGDWDSFDRQFQLRDKRELFRQIMFSR